MLTFWMESSNVALSEGSMACPGRRELGTSC